jgi:hypothetical protein
MIAHYHSTGNGKPIDWSESRRRCEIFRKKDADHGYRLPYKQGNHVRIPSGETGILTHKEYLYYNASMGREVWLLEVLVKAETRYFNNPADLRKVNVS